MRSFRQGYSSDERLAHGKKMQSKFARAPRLSVIGTPYRRNPFSVKSTQSKLVNEQELGQVTYIAHQTDVWTATSIPHPQTISASYDDILSEVAERSADFYYHTLRDGNIVPEGEKEHVQAIERLDSCTELYYDSFDALIRSPVTLQHSSSAPWLHAKQKISSHFHADIPNILDSQFNVDHLIPYLDPIEQLAILRVREKVLLCEQLAQKWDQYRPPQDKWWELRDVSFSVELRRQKHLLNSEFEQIKCHRHRALIMDLYERARLENESM